MLRPIKILFLAANPKNTDQLRLDEEVRSIDQALRQAEFRDLFDVKQQWAVRVSDIQSHLLRHKPDIVHFSGHGSASKEIILEDNYGKSKPVSNHAISQLFSLLKDNIRCVVLNACYSEKQAKDIAKHIDCVIGMSQEIGDLAAISFAVAFYQALGYGRNVKTAFDLGCLQIDLENMPDQNTPKLIAINTNPQEIVFISDPIGLENQFRPDVSSQHNTNKNSSINIKSHAGSVNISGKSTKIEGNVIGGNIHGDVIIKKEKTSRKSWIESTQAKLTMLVTLLGILSTLFILKDQIIINVSSSRFQTKVVDFQSNVGISGVAVVLSEVDGKSKADTTKTSSDGSFLVKVNAKPGTKIRLNFTHPGYVPFNEYYETENPKIIQLVRKTK